MGQVIPKQQPAVVLRSHFEALRAGLAIALVVLVALAAAVVVLATDDDSTTTSTAKPAQSIEYGSFNPQTGRPMSLGAQEGATPNVASPDASKTAAAIWRAQQARDQSGPGGPDESHVAAAIGR